MIQSLANLLQTKNISHYNSSYSYILKLKKSFVKSINLAVFRVK